jgi:hypothetical protein
MPRHPGFVSRLVPLGGALSLAATTIIATQQPQAPACPPQTTEGKPDLDGSPPPFLPEHTRVDEFFCENNRDYKPLFGAK